MMQEVARGQPNGLAAFDNGADDVGGQEGIADCLAHAVRWDGVFGCNLVIGFACFDSVEPGEGVGDIAQECAVDGAWMRSASSRMRSGPIERQAANALRSRRIDTEPGLSLLLPEHSPLKSNAPRRALASSECGSTRPRRSWHPVLCQNSALLK